MNDLVMVTVDAGIADVRLNRPQTHNSLTLEMFRAVIAAGEEVGANASVRVAVLSGNGPSFCAGLDMSVMQAVVAGTKQLDDVLEVLFARDTGPDNVAQRAALIWKTLPIPVIAAVHGVAFGGGCQIALGADIRIAAPTATLSVMEARYGLIPDMGITQTLPDLVPIDVAKELTMTARTVSAEEAWALGLVTRIAAEPHAAAMELAQAIAARSPGAVKGTKRLNAAWREGASYGLELEESIQRSLIGSAEQMEAVAASLEKRALR